MSRSCARALLLFLSCAQLAGCSPALDWREFKLPESQLLLLVPCKPGAQQRWVPLAGQPVRLTLYVCSAGGQSWSLAVADLADPARIALALAGLLASATDNIGGAPSRPAPFLVPGATPNPGSLRSRLQGKLPDGRLVHMQVAVFTHGTHVFQATVLGEAVALEAAEVFFDGLRVVP